MPAPVRPNSAKISEAEGYLKSARMCLLNWVRESYVESNNVTENIDNVAEMLAWSTRLENLRIKLNYKASVLDGRNPFAPPRAAAAGATR